MGTGEAIRNGWRKSSEECTPHLGYPWTFNGEVSKGAPVTLYFSMETKHDEGALTGIAVHYFDNVAPVKMIESFIFSNGTYYDTIQIAFHGEDTDVCEEGALPNNGPGIYLILAEGKGIKAIPITEDAAKESGEWALGACLTNMGTHWEHDIVGGSNLTFKAENLFPITLMYDIKGPLNGIFFSANAPMQNWDVDYCGVGKEIEEKGAAVFMECSAGTNMWDGAGPGVREETVTDEAYMCGNFCDDTCPLTGAAGDPAYYTTMHWFFVSDQDITACATGPGPECEPLV